ncbi:MAG: hypothetical protein Q8M15_05490 [Bacteroidota bacterium]|nr:hypothetical protein [Bacteroidota bacterium]
MKNKNLKININRPVLSKAEIESMKDFNGVLKQFASSFKPFYQKPWFAPVMAAGIIIIATGVYWFIKPTENTIVNNQQKNIPELPFIHPASTTIQIPYNTYEVESGKATTIVTPTGTRIIIPDCPFVDKTGKSIKGKVNIKYREFRDPVDFAFSGIPMDYDSAGKKYQFESAGMCELLGTRDNEPIFVNLFCPVKIEMKPVKTDPKFNLYFLDTVKKTWVFEGKPEIEKEIVKEKSSDNQFLNENIIVPPVFEVQSEQNPNLVAELLKLAKLEKPVKPQKAIIELPHFDLKSKFDQESCTQLNPYKNVVFEVKEEDKLRSVELFKLPWDEIIYSSIECGKKYNVKFCRYEKRYTSSSSPKRNEYKLIYPNRPNLREPVIVRKGQPGYQNDNLADTVLIQQKERIENLLVYPVFEEGNYLAARNIYNSNTIKYNNQIAFKLAEEKTALEITERIQEKVNARRATNRREYETFKQEAMKNPARLNSAELMSSFKIQKFGIYNCDYPYLLNGAEIALSFTDESQKEKYVDIIYQCDLTQNAMISRFYYGCCNNHFKYKPGNNLILFTIYANGKMGYYTVEDCKKLPLNGSSKICLRTSDNSFSSVAEVKKFLGIELN